MKIINPIEIENWDNLALLNKKSSIFHSAAWARVLYESYNYRPLYFAQISENKFKALIPLMEVNSIITGRRGVSLPFSDVCDPIIDEDIKFEETLKFIIDYGKSAKWKHIEFRIGNGQLNNIESSKTYLSHILDLGSGEQSVYSQFRSSTKRNIAKAIKENVETRICISLDSMKEFYRLNCLTRKHHGLPVQPWQFFKKVHQHIISPKNGFVVLALKNGKIISSAVYFLYGLKAVYKWGASDREYNYLRANNLVMWRAIEWCIRNGYISFDFGRTEQKNQGLLQFKRGWRGRETIINYFKYDYFKKSFIREDSIIKSSYSILKIMPLPILRFAGRMLYRHVG